MRKLILTTVFCISIPLLVMGLPTNDLSSPEDSTRQEMGQPVLQVHGAKVYNGNTLLTRAEVVNFLSSSPAIASQYERAKGTRGVGVGLLVGGAVVTTGGLIIMVSGMSESLDYDGYSFAAYGDTYYTGLLVAVLGELMLDGGIACTIIGKIKIRRSISNYNNTVNQAGLKSVPVNYQFGLLDNGNFGLKLTF